MPHTLTLRDITPVTHNVNQLTFDRPEGFDFRPGQATEMKVLKDGWRDEGRPFTFTSQPDDDDLQFVIKSYPSHDGVTEQIGQLQPGDEVEISDVWGAIEDKGKGVFFAGGAGLTPFIPILRRRALDGEIAGNTLVFAAKKERDLILREEWDEMDGLETRYVLSDENHPEHDHGHIDLDIVNTYVQGNAEGDHVFYICGPDPMIDAVRGHLTDVGVAKDRIVTEDGH